MRPKTMISVKPASTLTVLVICALMILFWMGDSRADHIMNIYDIPANSSGLAWDGELLWFGGTGPSGNWIRALNPISNQVVDSVRAPVPDCMGLAWFEGGLAYLSPRSDTTFLVTHEGSRPLFTNPYKHLGGLGSEKGNLWSSTYFDPQGTVLKLNDSGQITLSLPYSGKHSRDMACHRNRLYIPDRLTQEIRIVNPETGRFIRTFFTPGCNPDGITSDGEFLYVMDDGDRKEGDRIYQMHISPDGNIRLSSLHHNYGSVVINEESRWALWVYNDGAVPAHMIDFESENGNDDIFVPHIWEFPRSIDPGDSTELWFTFQPAYQDSVQIDFGLTFDLDHETYWVNLRGKGVRERRDILIRQRQLDFQLTRYGEYLQSSTIRYLLLENNGGESLTVEDLRFSNPAFFYGFYDFPHTFEEPGLYQIPIFFRPRRDGMYNETMTIVSDDEDSPNIQIALAGQAELQNPLGGTDLWHVQVGSGDFPSPQVRAIQNIEDITGDGLADVVIASNDYKITAYHAASTNLPTAIWTHRTDANPWRCGLVVKDRGLAEGDDWNNDGICDVVAGFSSPSMQVVALSGNTGEEIWIFDAHGLRHGGGDVIVARGEFDFTDDQVNDVFAAVAGSDNEHSSNTVILLDGIDGQILWNCELDSPPFDVYRVSDVTGDDISDLIATCEDGSIIGIDGSRGRIIWTQEVEGVQKSVFPIDDVNEDGNMDFGIVTYESGISVINGSNGITLWNNRAHDELAVGIALNDLNGNGSPDIVYGDENYFVRAIDGRTACAAWDTSQYIGSPALAMVPLMDFDNDARLDYLTGTSVGRLFALSGNGWDVLWSFSNIGDGHGFYLLEASRDVDGNGEMDVYGAMVNGTVYCMSGSWVGNVSIEDEPITSNVPCMLMVDPAYPNPFNHSVCLPVRLNEPGAVDLKIFNLLGQEIYRHHRSNLTAGQHNFVWSGISSKGIPVPSGFYMIEVKSSSNRVVRPVELVK